MMESNRGREGERERGRERALLRLKVLRVSLAIQLDDDGWLNSEQSIPRDASEEWMLLDLFCSLLPTPQPLVGLVGEEAFDKGAGRVGEMGRDVVFAGEDEGGDLRVQRRGEW